MGFKNSFLRIVKKRERLVLLILMALLFLVPYFVINDFNTSHQRKSAEIATGLDSLIPLVPAFILVYFSAYIMPAMPYFFVKDKKRYRQAIIAYSAVMIIAYFVFIFFPVRMDRPMIDGTDIFSKLLLMAYAMIPPYNAFPSFHVALPFIGAFVSFNENKKYWWMFLWAALITISTLLVKQHLIWDLVAGFSLSLLVYLCVFSYGKRKN